MRPRNRSAMGCLFGSILALYVTSAASAPPVCPGHPSCKDDGGGDDGGGDSGSVSNPAVAYTAYRTKGRGDLYLMNADGSAATLLLEGSGSSGNTPAKEYANAGWSDDNAALAFTDSGSDGALFRMPVDGSSPPSALYLADADTRLFGRVDWRPTGEWIAFGISEDDGGYGDADIVVIPPAGGAAVNLTSSFAPNASLNEDVSIEFEPSWSPAGDRLVLRRWVNIGIGSTPERQQVLICDFSVDGQPVLICPVDASGDFVPLYEDESIFAPTWHPTLDLIAYEVSQIHPDGNGTNSDLFIEPPNGEGPCIHIRTDRSLMSRSCATTWDLGALRFEHSIAWSCDGQDLIVRARETLTGDRQLYLISAVLADSQPTWTLLKGTGGGERSLGSVASRRSCPSP